ncbi:MAG: RNA-binding protein [Bacteroidetes bacterium]|nr:RNA-binding protein [Bacteroidota bacterium]MBP7398555.1 RNA-binding protein [Chitinophagales bacterium]MBK7109951.1 RNA-binding protein [Bacteroidota bacterium]MBK8487323.1 RNA-binding protein [Bacteroidota bacterium]MBK8682938.1 RNA-binding protein [Bacteroidota bacterium]
MNIFVGKLNYSTTEDTLRNAFEAFGQVDSVKIIMDNQTGRSKGFGFVEMPDNTQANDAINGLNESEIDGRSVVVNKARPKTEGGGGGGGFAPKRNNFNRNRY